jgi:hypothetical protein
MPCSRSPGQARVGRLFKSKQIPPGTDSVGRLLSSHPTTGSRHAYAGAVESAKRWAQYRGIGINYRGDNELPFLPGAPGLCVGAPGAPGLGVCSMGKASVLVRSRRARTERRGGAFRRGPCEREASPLLPSSYRWPSGTRWQSMAAFFEGLQCPTLLMLCERKPRIGPALHRNGSTVSSRRSAPGIGSRGSRRRACRIPVHGTSPGKDRLDTPESHLAKDFSAHYLHPQIIHQFFHSGLGRGRKSGVSRWLHWRKNFQNLSECLRFARSRPVNGCRRRCRRSDQPGRVGQSEARSRGPWADPPVFRSGPRGLSQARWAGKGVRNRCRNGPERASHNGS